MPKILIVDDEAHIRLLLEQTLEDLEDDGVEILTAADGEEALAIITKELPELVFLDIMMPKMNGFEVCKTVKSEWKMAEIYIIMLTAKGQEFDKQKGQEMGVDIYMTKPFDPDVVLDEAIRVLKLTRHNE